MRGPLSDLRHALRIYLRTPWSSLIAVLVLAIGIAFVSAFISLYVDLVLKPHAGFEDSGDIVTLGQNDGRRLQGLPAGMIERMAEEATTLDTVVGFMTGFVRGDFEQNEDRPVIELVTRGFFDGLRPKLWSGRGFDEAEHTRDGEPVAVISYRYWQDQLDGAPDVLGTTIELDLQPMFVVINTEGGEPEQPDSELEYRIIGVMAPELDGISAANTSVWLPYERVFPLLVSGPANFVSSFSGFSLRAHGRLSEGANVDAVVGEMRARYAESSEDFTLQTGYRLDAIRGIVGDINVQRDSTRQLQLFLGASVLLALVAAANVSLFLLARAPGRRRELGIRMSVGAPVKRLARQLASEAALLVLAGAVLGLVVSVWLGQFLRGLAFLREAQWREVTLFDWRVLGLVGALLLLLTVLVSLAPILGLERLGIAASSRQIAARPTLAQRIAGTVQIAIAGTLAGAAIGFGWYLGSMVFGDPGYSVDNRYMAQYSVREFTNDNLRQLLEASLVEIARRRDAIETIPGITAAAIGWPVPGANQQNTNQFPDPDDPSQRVRVRMGNIDSRYVDVLGLRLAYGRAPEDSDGAVALVNEAFAREYFGRENVVGEPLPFPIRGDQQVDIVGVLEDLSFDHPAADVEPIMFLTFNTSISSTAIIETSLTAAALQQELQRIADAGEIELEVNNVRPLGLLRSEILAADRARGFLTIGTAALVVLLAGFGFYGTQRYLVTAGRREYAIRASLGAGPKALGRLVLTRGILLGLPGLVAGTLLAFILVAWLRDDFISRDVSPPAVTAAVVGGLVALLLVASLGPARQARRTQPAPLLKED